VSALAFALALVLEPSGAHACGGFFCNQSAPVNQAAERIVFARGADGTVTAIIQIQYSGPSERFAWLLPVAGTPEIGVSSNSAFSAIQAQTNPSYALSTTFEGTCSEGFSGPRFGSASRRDGGAAAADAGGAPTVLDRGSVGPYDYVLLAPDPESTDRVGDTVRWLTDNDYDVATASGRLLGPYLDAGMNLVAFRLTKGNSTGSIRPVRLTFGNGLPSIPIRPTAVAANADMGVMVFVLGSARAVPANYLALELNEAIIDWLNPGPTYDDVVTLAANEAGGQGFVTEFAGSTRLGRDLGFGELVYPTFTRTSFDRIERGSWDAFEGRLLLESSSAFTGLDGLRDAILEAVPLPEGVDAETFLACPSCYYDPALSDIAGFDPAGYIASLRRHVIEPLAETRALFDAHEYLTRLYTTMSADEMTMDPVFDFNAELPSVSNVHTAARVIECSPSVSFADAPWRVTLADGTVVRGLGSTWPFAAGDMPANARTLRFGTSGTGNVVEDNRASIGAAVDLHNRTIPRPQRVSGGGASCAISWGGSEAAAAVVFLLLWARRRR
jgi:hypothetical protein